jgi:hypothetical protein
VLPARGQGVLANFYTWQGFWLANTESLSDTNPSTTTCDNSGSTALAMSGAANTVMLDCIDGAAFSVVSIDLPPLWFTTGANIVFLGTLAGGGTVPSTEILSALTPVTHSLDASFTNLETAPWSQVSPYHQWGNISLTVADVPLPAALPLLAVALGGLGSAVWARRFGLGSLGLASRRRKAA